jgi:CDP-glucose 4,6-dehydratase
MTHKNSPVQGMFGGLYAGKRVFVTGHTGFKGSWLCEWLLGLGAKVTGYSLSPPTQPALFEQLGLAGRLRHIVGDIRDLPGLSRAVRAARPDYVFHLAAQTIVRDSYANPVETLAVNVMGTVHVLEALRSVSHPCAAVCVTTDKCYENREWVYGYRENDSLGGHDPYSASKAAAELAIGSYRRSFFQSHPVRIASARAGNVIGGGDWAADRIVPDCMRALEKGKPIPVRNPKATRPWQHVLEPLSGYLWLGACLAGALGAEDRRRRTEDGRQKTEGRGRKTEDGSQKASAQLSTINHQLSTRLDTAFNFGPGHESNRTVVELVTEVLKHWPGRWQDRSDPNAVHEAKLLQLATDKANALLRWAPVWTFPIAVEQTVQWYREAAHQSQSIPALTTRQIQLYSGAAAQAGLRWTI